MSKKYLLPCSNCSAKIEIEPKNAGNQIRCGQCGYSVTVPKLREIMQLEEYTAEVSSAKPTGKAYSPSGRWLTLIGLLLIVGGLVPTIYIHVAEAGIDTEIGEYRVRDFDRQVLEQASPAKLLDFWDTILSIEMPEWEEHRLRRNQRIVAQNHVKKLIGLGVASTGLLLLLSVWLIPGLRRSV
ncbi:MAG TPA: hypothetical protein PKD64_07470 [Pirellulaceae bacterium]|nr:hypothetical protein [Pirellulaceae bacterium]HMO92025.1 hypothetical protein [Pirellulaceae bacterium]HMP68824.1 hypothetical protein [Pirellulaceae bacterium]